MSISAAPRLLSGRSAKSGDQGCFPIIAWQREELPDMGRRSDHAFGGHCSCPGSWTTSASCPARPSRRRWRVAALTRATFSSSRRLLGLGTPHWDFGARSLVHRHDRGHRTSRTRRAVLRGIAQRGADLLESAEADAGQKVARLRVDGGMTANPVFVQELADACQRPVEIAAELEATSLGAGLLAGLAADGLVHVRRRRGARHASLDRRARGSDRRARWKEAVSRARAMDPGAVGPQVLTL